MQLFFPTIALYLSDFFSSQLCVHPCFTGGPVPEKDGQEDVHRGETGFHPWSILLLSGVGEVHIPGQMRGCGGALGDNGPVQPQQLLGQPYPSHLSI